MKKSNRGRLLKVASGFALLIGAALIFNENSSMVFRGYTPTDFSTILPYVLGMGALACFFWAWIKKKGAKTASASKEKTQSLGGPTPEGRTLSVIRRCDKKDCPMRVLFTERGFCASEGNYPGEERCKLDEATFDKLFASDAYLNT